MRSRAFYSKRSALNKSGKYCITLTDYSEAVQKFTPWNAAVWLGNEFMPRSLKGTDEIDTALT